MVIELITKLLSFFIIIILFLEFLFIFILIFKIHIKSIKISRIFKKIKENSLYLIFLISFFSVFGSLFFSEIADYSACNLCWYQRIFMYPIFLISFFSSLKKDFGVNFYNFILASFGFLIASYHYITSTFNISDLLICNISNSCLVEYFKEFGFVTLPLMSAVSFVSIIFLSSFYFFKNINLN